MPNSQLVLTRRSHSAELCVRRPVQVHHRHSVTRVHKPVSEGYRLKV